jgi:hypothetical protein
VSLCTIIGVSVFGLFIALIANFPVQWFIWFARVWSRLPRKRDPKDVGVPPWLTGTFERLLAYTVFFLAVSEAYTILMAWIVAKLASNWQRRSIAGLTAKREREIRVQSLIALLAGTFSVAIGAAAGAIARSNPETWSWLVANASCG